MSQSSSENDAERVTPYDATRPKGEQVEEMFDSIAPAYDFMNTAMSFGLHHRWRNTALDMATRLLAQNKTYLPGGSESTAIIDLATGTGDVAFALAKRFEDAHITGVDLSEGMLSIARKKREESDTDTASRLNFEQGDCLSLTFPDNTFHLATIAYGVRNFENLLKGLREIHRVLQKGGVCTIIELSRPRKRFTRMAYDAYSRLLIPLAGRLASRDSRAYSYLPESIAAMPQREEMTALLKEAGFSKCEYKSLTLGVVCIYTAIK